MEREQTTLRLPKKWKDILMQAAHEHGMSFNEYVMILLNQHQSRHISFQRQQHGG